MRFLVMGTPTGKARPRFTKTGHTYTPQKTVDYEELVRIEFLRQCKDLVIQEYDGAVKIQIEAYFEPAKSTSKKYNEMLGNNVLKKPDLDNIAKAVCDSLNKIAYKDDSQIVDLTISKRYSNTARIEVDIYYLQGG